MLQEKRSVSRRLTGKYWFVHAGGRVLQAVGLLLIWWVLLLFTSAGDIAIVLYGGFAIAILLFYLGWGCTIWARKHQPPTRNLS